MEEEMLMSWMLGMDRMKATVGLFVYDCKIAWKDCMAVSVGFG